MKLTTASVGVPVFSLKASITHSIVRKPSVFERMVLRLCRRGQENQVVGDASLREAFEEHLGVQGIPHLLYTTVSGLVRLGALNKPETSANASLLDQPIRAIRLTPEGEDFYNKNTLPGSRTQDAVDYFYAPWSNSLSSARPGKLVDEAPELSFDERLLKPRDPSSLVRREVEEDRPRFLKRDSRIITVDAQIDESVRWLRLDIEVHGSPEGYLDLKTGNRSFEDWLAKLEPSVVQETFLDAVIGKSNVPDLELPREILGQAKHLALAAPPTSTIQPTIALPNVTRSGLVIHLDPAEQTSVFTQNDSGPAIITCPAPPTVPRPLASLTIERGRPTECQVEGDVALTWSGGLRAVRVRADLEGEMVNEYWRPFSDFLAATLSASSNTKIATVPFSWSSDRPIDSLTRQLTGVSLIEALEKMGAFLTATNETGVRLQAEYARRIAETLTSSIDATSDGPTLELALVDEWARFIIDSLGQSAATAAVTRSLLGKAIPPSTALEVRQLLALKQRPQEIPTGLLGPNVLAAVLEELWKDPCEELPAGNIDGLRTLEAYRSAQASLDASLGRQHANLAATGRRVTATRSVGEALRAAERWLEAVNNPALAHGTGEAFPAGLLQLRENVRGWRDAAKANLAPELETGTTALVFDSNTLLDHPDALRQLTRSQIGVIPNRVIQELDGLKRSTDGETARKARAANSTIDELRERSSLRFEKARAELIPLDFGPVEEPDNQILSVAIAYSSSTVTLVTGDKNLRNKAQASNIVAKDWPSLQEGRGKRR